MAFVLALARDPENKQTNKQQTNEKKKKMIKQTKLVERDEEDSFLRIAPILAFRLRYFT